MSVSISDLDFKERGLMPVVVQDWKTREVLMVAFANREAVEKTIKKRLGYYWSRSRGKLWMKGETSGHVQKVRDILVDCDMDTLVYIVEQTGPACHTGEKSCFYRRLSEFTSRD